MGFRSLNASIKKMANTIEKQRKAQLKARTAHDWLTVMHDEYVKRLINPTILSLKKIELK